MASIVQSRRHVSLANIQLNSSKTRIKPMSMAFKFTSKDPGISFIGMLATNDL